MNAFLDTLVGFYKACPFGPNFTRKIERAAAEMTNEQQVEAAERLVRSRKAKGWPSLTECEEALRSAGEMATAPVVQRRWKSSDELRAEETAARRARFRATRLCRCDLGRQAAREGWLNALVEWVADHGRLPAQPEIGRIVALARRNRQSLADLEPDPERKTVPLGEQVKQHAAMTVLYRAMQARAYREVFGEEMPVEEAA